MVVERGIVDIEDIVDSIVDSIVDNIEGIGVGMVLVWDNSLVGGKIVALCRVVGCKMGLVVDMALLGVVQVLLVVH